MKIKTLLPILGLTSVAAAAPVVASCAKQGNTMDWKWISTGMGEKATSLTTIDLPANEDVTISINLDGMSKENYNRAQFAFAEAAALEYPHVSKVVKATLGDKDLVPVESSTTDSGYCLEDGILIIQYIQMKKTDTLKVVIQFETAATGVYPAITFTNKLQ